MLLDSGRWLEPAARTEPPCPGSLLFSTKFPVHRNGFAKPKCTSVFNIPRCADNPLASGFLGAPKSPTEPRQRESRRGGCHTAGEHERASVPVWRAAARGSRLAISFSVYRELYG